MASSNLQALLIIIAAVPLISADAGYGLCSEVYQMHQYCTRATSELENVGSVEHTRVTGGRVGKQGPRGFPGSPAIVNYTAIDKEISKKIQRAEKRIDAKFLEFEKSLNKSQEKITNLIARNEEIESRVENKLEEYERLLNGSLREKISEVYPVNCGNVSGEDAKVRDEEGGVFDIYPKHKRPGVEVYCDLTTDGGGWTVFQRRMDGSVDFYRNWTEYVNGFGYSDKEMWLGLEKIHQLTRDGEYELRVDLGDWEGNTAYAKYGKFSIASSSDNYRLTVGQYSGTAGNSFSVHNQVQFSSHDQPHDTCGGSPNCAEARKGAWWYHCCHESNLNGMYYRGGKYSSSLSNSGVVWFYLKRDYYYSLKDTEMKFRKKN